jgi:hypothetical protein
MVLGLAVGTLAFSASGTRDACADASLTEDEERDAGQSEPGAQLRRFRDNAVVAASNQRAHDIALAEDQFLTFKGHRALAMMHLAMHDALNAIVPVYRPYTRVRGDHRADPLAAAAQAAHDVLVSQYPGEKRALDADLHGWLSRVADGQRRSRGIAVGQRAAAAVLAVRAGDGFDFPGTYSFRSEIGAYQTTPPWNGFVAQPGFRFARPFGLASPTQLRPPPPPALDSAQYAAAYEEVKQNGRVDSGVRTPDQTGYAVWWMEFAEGSVNRLARELVGRRHTHLWRAARLFALLNMGLFDTYVAVWDSKYEHNHWRPYTAVREAGRDGNAATEPDPTWEPLRTTPPFPEYVSAHAAACASSFEMLKRTFGDQVSFEMRTTTAPPDMPTRAFDRFSEAAAECADSRVRLGFHFRYATEAGLTLGRRVARYVAGHHLERRPHRGH